MMQAAAQATVTQSRPYLVSIGAVGMVMPPTVGVTDLVAHLVDGSAIGRPRLFCARVHRLHAGRMRKAPRAEAAA